MKTLGEDVRGARAGDAGPGGLGDQAEYAGCQTPCLRSARACAAVAQASRAVRMQGMEAGKRMGVTVTNDPVAGNDAPRMDAGFRDWKKKTRSACGFAA
ncbi:putative integral membrane protein [Alicycliphilus sp. B1]|nr:putative integral membrane protein [Alicycliphilus sp. B1]